MMSDIDLIEGYIREGKPDRFIDNCLQVVNVSCEDMIDDGRVEIVKWMFEHGADDHIDTSVALVVSCQHEHIDLVKYFLEFSTTDASYNNSEALLVSCTLDNVRIARLLLKSGASIHCLKDYLKTLNCSREMKYLIWDWMERV